MKKIELPKLHEVIQYLRKQKEGLGLTQQQLSKISGVHESQISRMISPLHSRRTVNYTTLQKLTDSINTLHEHNNKQGD